MNAAMNTCGPYAIAACEYIPGSASIANVAMRPAPKSRELRADPRDARGLTPAITMLTARIASSSSPPNARAARIAKPDIIVGSWCLCSMRETCGGTPSATCSAM
jgi:hypothetical protein